MIHVASFKFKGVTKSLKILYNVMQYATMQWPVGDDQRAYSNGVLR